MTVREFLLRVRKQNHMLLVYEQELTNLQSHASNISSPAFGDNEKIIADFRGRLRSSYFYE